MRNYLAELLQTKPEQPSINLWSVGCSTGEEAYSLAMVASDVIDYLDGDRLYGVVATDISRQALQVARHAEYDSRKLDAIPLAIRNKHIAVAEQGRGKIKQDLCQRVCFVQGNLASIDSWSRMSMDVIFCQNVLVYFQPEKQRHVLNNLVKHLKPGGLLVLAPAEAKGWQHRLLQRHPDTMTLAYLRRQPPKTEVTCHG